MVETTTLHDTSNAADDEITRKKTALDDNNECLTDKNNINDNEVEEDDYDYEEEEEEEEEEDKLTSEEIISLLNLAVENDRVDIVKEMLLQYPNYLNGNFREKITTTTPLHISIVNGSIQCLNCLLRMGANPSLRCNNKTAYESIGENNKIEQMKQAFFMEMVRVMNIGHVNRIEELLKSGYIPDKSIIDWIPDGDDCLESNIMDLFIRFEAIQQPLRPNEKQDESTAKLKVEKDVEEKKEEQQSPPPTTTASITTTISKLRQRIEESITLETQLSTNLEDMVQFITISQSLILSGSSALVAHVKRLKAQKIQKEVELDQYTFICHDLILKCNKEKEVVEEKEEKEGMDETCNQLTYELETREAKIRKLKATLLDLSEENTRILEQIHTLGLSGALRLTRKIHDDVRTLDFQIRFKREEECRLRKQLGLNGMLNGMHTKEGSAGDDGNRSGEGGEGEVEEHNDELEEEGEEMDDTNDSDEEDYEYESEEEENNQSNTTKIQTGKSNALIVRNSNASLDIWEIIRRLFSGKKMVGSIAHYKKKDN